MAWLAFFNEVGIPFIEYFTTNFTQLSAIISGNLVLTSSQKFFFFVNRKLHLINIIKLTIYKILEFHIFEADIHTFINQLYLKNAFMCDIKNTRTATFQQHFPRISITSWFSIHIKNLKNCNVTRHS